MKYCYIVCTPVKPEAERRETYPIYSYLLFAMVLDEIGFRIHDPVVTSTR